MHSRIKLQTSGQLGFSLVEVMVSIGIISIITAVIVVQYSSFNNSVLLKNQAYEVALDLREAQVFAISAQGQNQDFRYPYGIRFHMNTPNEYLLFTDANRNGVYNSNETIVERSTLDSRFEIARVCLNNCNSRTWVAATFARPDFDANFRANGFTSPGSVQNVDEIRIDIRPVDGEVTRTVVVSKTGQITVE